MSEGRWPVDVLLNWAMPDFFCQKGYKYSVKVDYDLLCVSPWKWDEIEPRNYILSAAFFPQNIKYCGIDDNLKREKGIDFQFIDYFNAGFAVVNNELYHSECVFKNVIKYYTDFTNIKGIQLAEQVALAFALRDSKINCKTIEQAYNSRVTTIPNLQVSDNKNSSVLRRRFNIINIHYLTHNKPWKPIDTVYLNKYIDAKFAHLYIYRNVWLNFAKTIPESKYYLSESPLNDIDQTNLLLEIFTGIYSRKY